MDKIITEPVGMGYELYNDVFCDFHYYWDFNIHHLSVIIYRVH